MKFRMFSGARLLQFWDLLRIGLVILLITVMLGFAFEQPVYAASIVVNTLVDEDNSNKNCSLREAIYAANHDAPRDACIAGSGNDIIVIQFTGVTGIITLGGTELSVTSDLTINGPGADLLIISGNDTSRVFNIAIGAEVVISDLTIANGNSALSDGGGILNTGSLTINRCTFSSNQTKANGGGIANYGMAEIKGSTFYDNQSRYNGGGVYNTGGTMRIENSTLSENRASVTSEGSIDNYGGGGIINYSYNKTAELTINNSTIAFNSAKWGGGISNSGMLEIKNTIVTGNTVHADGIGPNCSFYGSVTTSYSLESGTDCGFTGTGDLQSAAAELDPLQKNGGPTSTHALQADSQAIDAGSCTDTSGSPVTHDQRGFSRISPCDIGAYEYFLQTYLPLVKRN